MDFKIPFYNILNMFLTGFIFMASLASMFLEDCIIILKNPLVDHFRVSSELIVTFAFCAVIYEIGLIVNRLGSVAMEFFLRKTKLIPGHFNYKEYNKKKNLYPVLDTLSREYALSRTQLTLFLLATIIASFYSMWGHGATFLCIGVLYFLSCRKHAGKIATLLSDS